MTEKNIREYSADIQSSLEQKRLKETFDLLTPMLSDLQNWQLSEKKNELETTYKMMLRYLTEGVKDPERDHIYHDLLRSCYKLADSVDSQIKVKYTPGLYFDRKREFLRHQTESLPELIGQLDDISGKIALVSLLDDDQSGNMLSLEKENEAIFAKMFQSVWLSDQWGDTEKELIIHFLNNAIYPYTVKCLIISAITLSLQMQFDENKAVILLSACENKEDQIRQRAIVGLLLFLRDYDKRLFLYPSIQSRLNLLSESGNFVVNVRDIILQFILSKETERITRKIKEEILPEMMKISPKLGSKIRPEDLTGESGMDEKNPEWTKILEESGLNEKLQEFSELQMEGADIMHSSFAHLKTYSFFNEISNWLIPFSANHSAFNRQSGDKELLSTLGTLTESTLLCNSDKYSFCFSVLQMPESYRKMMAGQFAAESEAFLKMQKEELPGSIKKATTISKQYLQDLYRFYKIHPRKADFIDIFEKKPDFLEINSIEQLLSDKESMMIIGEYYLNHNFFREACLVFDKLIQTGNADDIIFQKKGYCLQMAGDLENALQAYLNAELLNANNSWTIKKIAYCYRILKKPKEALLYYRRAETFNPDNLMIQLNIGHCHFELKNYGEALKCYFKVEYLDRNGEKAWRPIAWCSFITGKYEQAMEYLNKILENQPNASDYLNSGHVQLAMGQTKKAISFYELSIKHPESSVEKFRDDFMNDMDDLIQAGILKDDIPFILDRLMYGLN